MKMPQTVTIWTLLVFYFKCISVSEAKLGRYEDSESLKHTIVKQDIVQAETSEEATTNINESRRRLHKKSKASKSQKKGKSKSSKSAESDESSTLISLLQADERISKTDLPSLSPSSKSAESDESSSSLLQVDEPILKTDLPSPSPSVTPSESADSDESSTISKTDLPSLSPSPSATPSESTESDESSTISKTDLPSLSPSPSATPSAAPSLHFELDDCNTYEYYWRRDLFHTCGENWENCQCAGAQRRIDSGDIECETAVCPIGCEVCIYCLMQVIDCASGYGY